MGRVVTPGSPLWTDTDRQWALALLAEERETHSCGQPISESFAEENDGRYVADALRCHACAATQREAKEYADNSEGLHFTARKVEP